MGDEDISDVVDTANNRPTDAPRGLVCGACGHVRLRVVYTRPGAIGQVVRRRECKKCGERVTTWERKIGQLQMCNEGSAV